MRKLVVYPTEEMYHANAGSYPCLVNYDHINKRAEFDDGCGNTMHIDFHVASEFPVELAKGYHAVELIGFGG